MSKAYAASKITLNAVDIVQASNDPSSGGFAAAIGSLYLRSGTAQMWLKTGSGDTNWQKLANNLNWFSVKDYLAKGDGTTDDTISVQAAINACATAGGGRVFFPPGSYKVSQILLNNQPNIQLQGCGPSSVIKWGWDAVGAAGSLITIKNASDHIRIAQLKFDGSGLVNPHAGRLNHLIAVGDGTTTGPVDFSIMYCVLAGMIASSGDGVHVLGSTVNPVSRYWIKKNIFEGCSRFGSCIEEGANFGWIENNFFTSCETDIAVLPTTSTANNGLMILGNEIIHTGSVRHAVRIEGNSTTPSTKITFAQNTVLGGFVTTSGVTYSVLDRNVITSGSFASSDPVWKISGNTNYQVVTGNMILRESGSSVGVNISVEKATSSPAFVRVGRNMLLNDTTGGGFVKVVDAPKCSVGSNICHSANGAGAYGIDVQAVTTAATDILVGPGNQFTAAAGSFASCIRLLANGANVSDISVVGNQGDNTDFALRLESISGSFNGQLMFSNNNVNAATGDIQQVGVTVRPRIGFNGGSSGTVGPQLFQGTGTPEAVISARIGSMYLRTDGGQASVVYYKETGTGNTGWVAIGGSSLVFGADDVSTASTALYLAPGYISTASATEMKIPVTRPGTIRNLRVQVATAGTDVTTNTYTVRKGGVDQTLSCTIGNTSTGIASDTSNSFTVVAGDLISISVTKGIVVTAGQKGVVATVEIV
jgi:hypothetical protein